MDFARRLAVLLALAAAPALADNVAWRHGLWFDGAGFVPGTRYTVDGVFAGRVPASIDREVDLGYRHVVPAYGDAHHHGIDSADGIDDKILVFLEAGIYYVKNPNVIAQLLTPEVRARLNRPGSISIAFANAGITASGGHPAPLHEYLAGAGVFRPLGPADMQGRAYVFVDSVAELEAKWPRIVAGKPDFLKTFVLFSEEYSARRDVPGAHKGLDPRVLAAIVERAHAARLRVTAHVDTATDFRHAVEAGVDEINHLPQPDQRFSPDLSAYVIDGQTARLAARRGITVVATAGTTERLSGVGIPIEWLPAMRDNQRANLRRLIEAGVAIAIGSDSISGERRFVTGREEVKFLARHHMLDPLQLLRAWSVDTPRTIFPARRLGALDPGYEADFLVLDADPLDHPDNLHRIGMRVQAGQVLPEMPVFALGR